MDISHILLIIEIGAKGTEVFGSQDKFISWLSTENLVFSGKKPVEYLMTYPGSTYVRDKLINIEWGDTA